MYRGVKTKNRLQISTSSILIRRGSRVVDQDHVIEAILCEDIPRESCGGRLALRGVLKPLRAFSFPVSHFAAPAAFTFKDPLSKWSAKALPLSKGRGSLALAFELAAGGLTLGGPEATAASLLGDAKPL